MVTFHVGGCNQFQQGSVVTWSTTDVGKDLIEWEKARPETDFILASIFIRNAGLLVLRSTNRVVRWEE